ncbi:MAG: glycine--tRNA ligase subunit beta, partial [Armatimonadota bacterium]
RRKSPAPPFTTSTLQQEASARLGFSEVRVYGAPRRLAAHVIGLAEAQADAEEEVKGPPAERAFDADGRPTAAAMGFAKARGVSPDVLYVRETDKGPYVFARVRREGRPTKEVLADVFLEVTSSLTFPKTMRWGDGKHRFARPIRWVVTLFGDEVVPVEVGGVSSSAESRGHRFLSPGPVGLERPGDYLGRLQDAFVLADAGRRREVIREQVCEAARQAGGVARLSDEALEETCYLVEWPTALYGAIDEQYMSLPEEVLVTMMWKHQRYFPVEDESGALLPRFVAVRDGNAEHLDAVRRGNERVLRSQLADAAFFFGRDLKATFQDWQNELRRVIFQDGAGSMYEKCQRLQRLTGWLGEVLRPDMETEAAALRAAELCKADLASEIMVELPELQGIMGGIYAELRGEAPECAMAIREHYMPVSATDALPSTLAGRMVGLADRMDTLAACTRLGYTPRGTEDPLGLRRQAHGLVRIIVDGGLTVPIAEFVDAANAGLADAITADDPLDEAETRRRVMALVDQRLDALMEERGIAYDIRRAILNAPHDDLLDAFRRAEFLAEERRCFPEFDVAANEATRFGNIVRPQSVDEEPWDERLFVSAEERQLVEAFAEELGSPDALSDVQQMRRFLRGLAPKKIVIDEFFDNVKVVIEPDETLRLNRLRLLRDLDRLTLRIADFQALVQQSE